MKAMHSYFARHAVDKEGKAHEWGSDEDPSAGYVVGCSGAAKRVRPGPIATRRSWPAMNRMTQAPSVPKPR